MLVTGDEMTIMMAVAGCRAAIDAARSIAHFGARSGSERVGAMEERAEPPGRPDEHRHHRGSHNPKLCAADLGGHQVCGQNQGQGERHQPDDDQAGGPIRLKRTRSRSGRSRRCWAAGAVKSTKLLIAQTNMARYAPRGSPPIEANPWLNGRMIMKAVSVWTPGRRIRSSPSKSLKFPSPDSPSSVAS